jgi:membrane protease YdiL (CAAX protease family)
LPDIMAIWCLNNLFFVSFAEEVIFRGLDLLGKSYVYVVSRVD